MASVLRIAILLSAIAVLRATLPKCDELIQDPLDEYEFNGTPKSTMQANDDWQSKSASQRRESAVKTCYTIKGLCVEKNRTPCTDDDAQWLARVLATGDAECFFLCNRDRFKENIENLPSETAFPLGSWFTQQGKKDIHTTDNVEHLMKSGGADMSAKKTHKRDFGISIFFVLVIIKVFIDIGSMAAIGYVSNTSDLDEMGTMSSKAGQVRAALTPALKASGGCFDAESTVMVKGKKGKILKKRLADLKEGELVQSVTDSGSIEFSKVYYIEHAEGARSKLLSITLEGKQTIGLSGRHLIYASKTDVAVPHSVMAKELTTGDILWELEKGELKARKILSVTPYIGSVIHPLTENHHILVNNVHASVHILNENMYRLMTTPLRWVCHYYPQCGQSAFVKKMVRFVEDLKEPFAKSWLGANPMEVFRMGIFSSGSSEL